MSKLNYTILVIEDDPLVNSTIKDILSEKYARVETYTDAQKAQDEIHIVSPDLILLDIFLGHHNGLDVLDYFRKMGYKTPVIIITAFSDIKMAVRAMKLGAEDFIVKPLDLEQLEISVEKSLGNYEMRRQVEVLSEQLREEHHGEILGTSPGIRRAMDMGRIFARSDDTTVMILGETGTGKELMARFIHDNSERVKRPFVTINCGAIPRELAESEFFGYEKGAFTGATEKLRLGKFEQANHGTIFLDEIGELSLDLQVKLLRVLQDKTFYRLGGAKEINVDVRVVAATNRNLEKEVEDGKFREDLFYRLNVAVITLPPLRDRGDDILALATAFVNKFNKKFGKNIRGFSQEAANIMTKYFWKGNIRELTNVLERVVLLESETVISADSLSFLDTSLGKAGLAASSLDLRDGDHYLKIAKTGAKLLDVTRDLIEQTLKITNNNQIKAAKLLGISRSKLRYRMEQFGMMPAKE